MGGFFININRNEVLRYLGYKKQVLDENMEKLIDECINEIYSLAKSRYVYKFFDIQREEKKILLKNSSMVLEGKDIVRHLQYSDICVLMAVSLGSAVDMKIRYYEKIDMTKALILDACASTAIEEVCDRACVDIGEKLKNENKKLTTRFSPGYGDLPINIQKKFLEVLEAFKVIGVSTSSNSILIPRKSVTAVVGAVDKNRKIEKQNCINCNKYLSCEFRKGSVNCGN
ncbi:MAG: methionine synthase [Candidatus Afipia apatlaquensis]|uniref:Methionine synthase n=1 Tax=Candidatus Afipia apatlaquensis TaxID=2712852 RepID=A0A7C9VQH1_9BRAD|nr:methionine synthase [Candidatus Afipia apatlaquensis]